MRDAVDDAFMAHVSKWMDAAVKMKKVMLRKGLTAARAKCVDCGNETMQARLAGRKNHIRMWCDTPGCDMTVME